MANYYSDYTAANDSGAGTQGDPWKRCPGMVGWTGSHTPVNGDIYILKRGQTFPGIDTVNASVTYKSESGWGTGNYAIVTGNISKSSYWVSSIWVFDRDGKTITIDSIEATGSTGAGISTAESSSTITIQNCYIHGNGDHELQLWGDDLIYGVNVLNNIVDPNGGAHYAMEMVYAPNSIVRGNIFKAGGNYGADSYTIKVGQNSHYAIVERNYVQGVNYGNRHALVFRSLSNGKVRYNIVDQTNASGGFGGIALWSEGPIHTGNKVYNNTVHGNGTNDGISIGSQSGIECRNNIFYDCDDAYYIYGDSGTLDHDLIYSANYTMRGPGTGGFTQTNTLTSNPLFQGSTFGPDHIDDFKIQSGSPARDSGTNYDSYSGTDYWGTNIPQNEIVDRGAHEYDSGMATESTSEKKRIFMPRIRLWNLRKNKPKT